MAKHGKRAKRFWRALGALMWHWGEPSLQRVLNGAAYAAAIGSIFSGAAAATLGTSWSLPLIGLGVATLIVAFNSGQALVISRSGELVLKEGTIPPHRRLEDSGRVRTAMGLKNFDRAPVNNVRVRLEAMRPEPAGFDRRFLRWLDLPDGPEARTLAHEFSGEVWVFSFEHVGNQIRNLRVNGIDKDVSSETRVKLKWSGDGVETDERWFYIDRHGLMRSSRT